MNLPDWILNRLTPRTWKSARGLTLTQPGDWPSIIPVHLPASLPNIDFREYSGNIATMELEVEGRVTRKDIVLQLPISLDGSEETTPEVCCYPCDGNCLEVFRKLPVPAICNRPKDMDEAFRKHFGDV